MGYFVKFWGTRGSIPTPGFRTRRYGGNTPCVSMRIDDTLLICDAGSGLRELGLELTSRESGPIVGHMFFSHTHWDHIQGFPFFTPVYAADNTFYVCGTRSGDTRIHDLLSGQMKSEYFPVDFSELGAHILARDLGDGTSFIDDIQVGCLALNHPGGSFAYSFTKGGHKVVFATDCELDMVLENPQEAAQNPEVMRIIQPALVEFARGADLLIVDGQYSDQEYPDKVGWGHSRATTAVDLAVQAQVRRLAIFHHDPLQTDSDVDRKVEAGRSRAVRLTPRLQVFGAREGVELRIDESDDEKG
jgi:phosphoribosyl 1,2-cyclic phosphodiesterase